MFRRGKEIKLLILIGLLVFYWGSSVFAEEETNSYTNYLVILVHGINSNQFIFKGKGENGSDLSDLPSYLKPAEFGDLKGYLENGLGLKGHVYAYCFSERDGRISLMGRELGDPNHNNEAYTKGGKLHHITGDNKELRSEDTDITDKVNGEGTGIGNCWLEQAREDFIDWYYGKYKDEYGFKSRNDVPESVIPDKYILIAHSLGGAAARAYISSDYYRGDVAAIITIASQHWGSDSAQALKKLAEYYASGQNTEDFKAMIGIALFASLFGYNEITAYAAFSATYVMTARPVFDYLVSRYLGWYPSQPGVQDIDSKSSFMINLNAKPFVNTSEAFKVRTIAAYGIPTSNGNLPAINRAALGLEMLETFITANDFAHNGLGVRVVAAFMSLVFGAVANQSGDIYSNYNSQIAYGLSSLNAPNIDYKYYGYDFSQDISGINDLVVQSILLLEALDWLPLDPTSKACVKFGAVIAFAVSKADVLGVELKNYLLGHGNILKKAYEEKIIDQALDGIIPIGGRAQGVSKSGISAASVNTPTASYNDFDQAFVLLSNLDKNGNPTDTYHTVTIEAFTTGEASAGIRFPIEVNGQKMWVSAVTVKEAPTAIKGVINTFLPKKLKRFNYSENFAAWKPVGAVDEWGNFTIRDLKLVKEAEMQVVHSNLA